LRSGPECPLFTFKSRRSAPAREVCCLLGHEKFDSLDMVDAWHPQTLLAYLVNGEELPTRHGAPLRVRVPRQLGFKSKKYLAHVTVTDTVKNIGTGQGSSSPDKGFSWYGGI
jgi:DMSO/TMAO reductase YedYZ molybdopterin-dependent catalytic subunit